MLPSKRRTRRLSQQERVVLTLLNFALATPPPGGIGSIHVSLNQPVTDEISIIHDATIVNAAKAEIQESPWRRCLIDVRAVHFFNQALSLAAFSLLPYYSFARSTDI